MARGAHRGTPALRGLRLSVVSVAVLAVTATGVAQAASRGAGSPDTSTPRASTAAPTTSQATPAGAARRVGAVVPERPTSARLPSGTIVSIRPVGTTSGGRLDVPSDIEVAGWWRGGARLGDPFGSTLLAAHVDSYTQGLGPYSQLLSVRPGQHVQLYSQHLTQVFAVTSLRLVAKGTLPQHPQISSPRGERRLTLVTCAGPFVPSRGGYQNLAVITAVPLADAVRKTA